MVDANLYLPFKLKKANSKFYLKLKDDNNYYLAILRTYSKYPLFISSIFLST